MVRPVTTVEVLLQQIGDSLVEITGLLRQATADPAPTPEPETVVVTEPTTKPAAARPAKAASRTSPAKSPSSKN